MSDAYSLSLVSSLLTGTSTDRTKTTTASGSHTEDFWATVNLPSGASNTELSLNLLTDPLVLAILGSTGVWARVDSITGTKIEANPIAVLSDEAGLGISTIYLGNDDVADHEVTIIAAE